MPKRAILIAFTLKTKEFTSRYERVKFFKSLYGWKQIVPSKNREYEYRRPGLLNFIPHIKVDQSSFIIPEDEIDEIMDFFEKWADKVIFRTFKVLLEDEEWEEMLGVRNG